MDKAYFAQLYAYTAWANRQVWACVVTLTEAQFTQALPYSLGSIQRHIVHMMGVEFWWLHYLRTGELQHIALDDPTLTTYTAIRARWDAVEAANQRYIASLTPTELGRLVHPDHWDADERPISVAEALTQVALHSMDHRAQVLAALHAFGAPTVEQDFLNFLHASS